MPLDPTHARTTAVAATSPKRPAGALAQASSEHFLQEQLGLIKGIADERRRRLLRQGRLIDFHAVAEMVLLEALHAQSRHPDDLPLELRPFGDHNAVKRAWRNNYVLASECKGRHVWLAARGTDFMPVRCLVASRHRRGRHDVQVVVIRVNDDPDSLQVVTCQTLRALKALAVDELGLRLSEGLYWPSSRWAKTR
jgi:hypothetical protein